MTISPVGPDNHASLSSPWEQQEKASCPARFPGMVHKEWLMHPFPSCVYFHEDSWWIFENIGIVEWCSQSWLFFRFQAICREDDHRNNIEMVLCSVAAITRSTNNRRFLKLHILLYVFPKLGRPLSSFASVLHLLLYLARVEGWKWERGSEEGRIPNKKSLVTQNGSSFSSTLPHDPGQIVSSLSPVNKT